MGEININTTVRSFGRSPSFEMFKNSDLRATFVAVTYLIYLERERVLFEMVPFNCCVALSAFSLITTLSEGSKLGS